MRDDNKATCKTSLNYQRYFGKQILLAIGWFMIFKNIHGHNFKLFSRWLYQQRVPYFYSYAYVLSNVSKSSIYNKVL